MSEFVLSLFESWRVYELKGKKKPLLHMESSSAESGLVLGLIWHPYRSGNRDAADSFIPPYLLASFNLTCLFFSSQKKNSHK